MTRRDVIRAAEHIGAVQISPRRWAYYADETSRYYVVSTAVLASLCSYLDDDDPSISQDAYSHWCAGEPAREMPKGWEP